MFHAQGFISSCLCVDFTNSPTGRWWAGTWCWEIHMYEVVEADSSSLNAFSSTFKKQHIVLFLFTRTRHVAPKQSLPAYHLISGKSQSWHLHCKQPKCISISLGAKQSRTFQSNYMKDVAERKATASWRKYTPNKSNKQI